MRVRVATHSDMPCFIENAKRLHSESPKYAIRNLNEKALSENLRSVMDGVGAIFVAENNGEVVGGIVCLTTKDWFNDDVIAFEQVFYVQPEYRATRAPLLLIDAFVNWAKYMKADRIQSGTTTDISTQGCVRLYEHFGFIQYGIMMDMELTHE